MSGVDTLVEMGFPRNRAEKAWQIMGDRGGVQAAMEWLLEHNEDPDIDVPYKPPEGNVLGKSDGSTSAKPSLSETDASTEEVEAMTTESASTSETHQLTPEEKAEQLKRIQEKIKTRRLEREEADRKHEVEMEKTRRKQGQDISKIRAEIHFKEAQKQADIKKRQKREDAMVRERIKQDIARDRADKKLQEDKAKLAKTQQSAEAKPQIAASAPKVEHTHARLQIRLPNGSQIVHQFSAQEPLSAVRLFIELNRKDGNTDDFDLMTAFPKRIFTRDEMGMPLKILGLTPSAVLMVTKPH